MKKRVLIISFDFPPQGGTGAIRVTKFAKYLPEFGWQPVVVCSDTLWNPDESLARDVPDVPVYRVGWPRLVQAMRPAPPLLNAQAVSTQARLSRFSSVKYAWVQLARHILVPDTNVLWVRKAQYTCAQVLRTQPCDVVLTTSPPNSVHLVGQWIHSQFRLPWVADFRDVWTAENPALHQLGRLNFMRQRQAERHILQTCDRAITVTKPLAQQTLAVFGAHLADKILTITNGFDPEDFANPQPDLDNSIFTIAYLGTMVGPWMENALPEGIRYALTHSESFRKHVRFRFVGELGAAYRARLAGLDGNVEISSYVPHTTAIDIMRRSHLLVLTLSDTQLAGMTYTNKFFEYLAAQRPILAIVPPGLIRNIIEKERLGWVASPNDAQAIGKTLLTIFDSMYTHSETYGASEALLNRFNRRELTRQLATILDQEISQ